MKNVFHILSLLIFISPAYGANETKPHAIYAFTVKGDGKQVANQRLSTFVPLEFLDGMRLDASGNICVGALDGFHVYNPKGKLTGKILLPKGTANLAFGGNDNNIRFICSHNPRGELN